MGEKEERSVKLSVFLEKVREWIFVEKITKGVQNNG